jgi:hypothetical protein
MLLAILTISMVSTVSYGVFLTSRSQSGTAAASAALATCRSPNELTEAYGNHAADFNPTVKDSAIGAPISVATADISTMPFPNCLTTGLPCDMVQ